MNVQERIGHSKKLECILVAALFLLSTLQLIYVALTYSANWDEAHHLFDGYNIWTRHDYRLNAEVPPLVKLTAALPLLSMHIAMPADPGQSQAQDAFLEGRAFVFGNAGDRVLFPARMACIVFTLLLAWLIYAVGRHIFGPSAGLCALALFIFDPNVLAHGTLVSTDIASALFLFASVFAFYRYTRTPTILWLLATGLLTGLAMVAKFTGILVIPMLLLLCIAESFRLRCPAVLGRRLAACAGILAIGWLIIWVFYGFRYTPAPGELSLSPSLGPYLASLPSKADGATLALLARYRLLPEAYLWGLAIHDCWFAYFPDGAVQPQDYGVPCHRLPTPSGLWWLNLPMDVPPVISGTVLFSESDLEGVESGDGPLNPYNAFRSLKPTSVIQDGVYVYQGQFAVPLASAWVDVRKSNELDKAGNARAALYMAQQAVALAPDSTRTQLNLAQVLAAQGSWHDALLHYLAAEHCLLSNRPELEMDDFQASIKKGITLAEANAR